MNHFRHGRLQSKSAVLHYKPCPHDQLHSGFKLLLFLTCKCHSVDMDQLVQRTPSLTTTGLSTARLRSNNSILSTPYRWCRSLQVRTWVDAILLLIFVCLGGQVKTPAPQAARASRPSTGLHLPPSHPCRATSISRHNLVLMSSAPLAKLSVCPSIRQRLR